MSNSYSHTFQKLTAFFLLVIFSSNFAVYGQVKKSGSTAVAANQKQSTAPKCSGAWTGNVSYTRAQAMTDSKTVKRVSNRGEDKRDWEMRYNYKASVAVLESPERNNSNTGKARIEHKFSSIEKTIAREENSCDRGKTFNVMFGNFQTKSATTANATNAEANVSVGINTDGTYTVSVGVPQIKGQTTGTQTSSFSGQCVPKAGKNLSMPAAEISVDGNSLTSDGTHRVNASDPNRLSGSYSKTWQNVTETISWNLEKCGAPLRITNLQFEDMRYPNWNDWQEISEQKGTIDGNLVRIRATVLNESGETKYADVRFKETYKGDKWDGAKPDAPLKDAVLSVRVEANSEETVELLWDSSGYAWFDDGRPRVSHLIMLGTPNLGSPCADVMNVAFEMLGKNVEAVRQLRQDQVANFNTVNKYRKGVKFSALAGNPLPTMCKNVVWNDGVVSVPSAKWTIADTAETKSIHTDLTGTQDFSSFVKPRLAIGPKGNHNPEASEASQFSNQTGANLRNPFAWYFINASYRQPVSSENLTGENDSKPDFAKAVKLAPKQTLEIEIPVQTAQNFGLTFMAAPEISATLFDDKGVVVGKNLAKTPEASGWFRSIYFDKAVASATWKLKLENTSRFWKSLEILF